MALFKNKYRVESIRLPGWDYGSVAAYFITLCTKNRIHYFGEIHNGKMHPTALGEKLAEEWQQTPARLGLQKVLHVDFLERKFLPVHPELLPKVLLPVEKLTGPALA